MKSTTQKDQGPYYTICVQEAYSTAIVVGSYLTHILHTARISDFHVAMCRKRNVKYEPSIWPSSP